MFQHTFISLFVTTALLLLCLSLLLIRTANQHAAARNDRQMAELSLQMAKSFDNYVDTMRDTLSMLARYQGLNDLIEDSFESNAERYRAYSNFYNYASTFVRYKSYSQLFLVVPDLKIVVANNSVYNNIPAETLSDAGWMERMDESELSFFYLTNFNPPVTLRDELGFALAAPASRLANSYISKRAYLVMTTGKLNFKYAIQQSEQQDGTLVVLLNQEDEVMYASQPGALDGALAGALARASAGTDAGQFSVKGDGAGYRVYQAKLRNTGWKLALLQDAGYMAESDRELVRIVVLAMVAAIVLMGVLAVVLSTGITRPIRDMAGVVKEMSQENFDARVTEFPDNELGELGREFNHMAQRIDTLIRRVYQAELLERESQLFALQQQINPHFLYNTLEVINSLANKARTREIKQVVQKLAGLFRYSASADGVGLTHIQDELQYADDYLAIQKYRFPGRIDYHCEVEPELLELYTPKFVLQPIIENAINHGMRFGEGAVLALRLTGRRAPSGVELTIEDDGKGMEAGTLRDLEASLQDPRYSEARRPQGKRRPSIGLANVNARIKLMFSEAYGLQVTSAVGQGTRVKLTIPALNCPEKGGREAK